MLTWRQIVRHEYFSVAALILAVKLSIFLLGVVAFPILGDAMPANDIADLIPASWRHWDAHWYITIAENGYQTEGDNRNAIAFFPFYPLLIRLVSFVWHDFFWAATLVANAASVAGLLLFYKLAKLEFSRETAWWSLIALLLFPTAYFFNAPYTEGLFLLLSVGSFFAARRGKWLVAGILGGLAAFTRVTGLLLLPALLVEFYLQRRSQGRRLSYDRAVPLLLIPGVFGLYLLFNEQLLGDFWAFREVLEVRWYKQFAWPWEGLAARWRDIGSYPWNEYNLLYGMAEFGAGAVLVAFIIWSYKRLRLSYVVYMALTTFLLLSTSWLLSTPRYVLTVFPLFFLLGQLGRYRNAGLVWLVLSVFGLALFTVRYVHGWWAF